jgi:hypothetical protein
MALHMPRWTRRFRPALLVAVVAVAGIAVNMVLLGIAAESSGDPVGRFKARLSETASTRAPERPAPTRRARATEPRRPAKPTPATTTAATTTPSAPSSIPTYDDRADDAAEPCEREDD